MEFVKFVHFDPFITFAFGYEEDLAAKNWAWWIVVGREAEVLPLSVWSEPRLESGKSPLWAWLTNQKI